MSSYINRKWETTDETGLHTSIWPEQEPAEDDVSPVAYVSDDDIKKRIVTEHNALVGIDNPQAAIQGAVEALKSITRDAPVNRDGEGFCNYCGANAKTDHYSQCPVVIANTALKALGVQ